MERSGKPRKVLVARFSALGDVAMSVPVVYSACHANPDCEFFFLTKIHAASLFVNTPANLTVVGIDTSAYEGISGIRRLASELKAKYGIEAFADLHDVLRTKLLRLFLGLSGIRCRHIHKGRRGKKALTRARRKVFLPLTSTRMRYREVFHALGLSYADSFDGIFAGSPPSQDDFSEASAPKKPGETWIAIAPFAGHPGKIYPPELMERVIEALCKRPGYRIFIFGAGQKETNMIGRWTMKYDNIVNMGALSTGIPAELALMYWCDAMISMDSEKSGERLGSHASLLRLPRLAAEEGGLGAARHGVPSLFCFRRQALPLRRLPLHARHPSQDDPRHPRPPLTVICKSQPQAHSSQGTSALTAPLPSQERQSASCLPRTKRNRVPKACNALPSAH